LRAITVAVIVSVAVAAGTASAGETPTDRFEVVARRLVQAFNAQDVQAFQQDWGPVMVKALPRQQTQVFLRGLFTQLGEIQGLDSPRFVPPNQAVFPARFERGNLDIKIVLDERDRISGLWFLPHVPDIPVPEKHETELALPFKGRWKVFWGGDTRELNQHHDVSNQRYAFDFVVVDEEGRTHSGEGRGNEDYYAFGKEILAPADGAVTQVITGVRDNSPGSMNPYSALGNAVFIQHREHEVSVLAHLKLDSTRVSAGDRVTRGQVVGLCGNSGNSSEPHLHYHLQNTPVIQDGTGIKCFFQTLVVTREGKTEVNEECSPVKGDIVSPE